jgi:hypothetical protein
MIRKESPDRMRCKLKASGQSSKNVCNQLKIQGLMNAIPDGSGGPATICRTTKSSSNKAARLSRSFRRHRMASDGHVEGHLRGHTLKTSVARFALPCIDCIENLSWPLPSLRGAAGDFLVNFRPDKYGRPTSWGIQGIDLDCQIAQTLPDVRVSSGVVVVARATGSQGGHTSLVTRDVIQARS